jgi:hypothetical protein
MARSRRAGVSTSRVLPVLAADCLLHSGAPAQWRPRRKAVGKRQSAIDGRNAKAMMLEQLWEHNASIQKAAAKTKLQPSKGRSPPLRQPVGLRIGGDPMADTRHQIGLDVGAALEYAEAATWAANELVARTLETAVTGREAATTLHHAYSAQVHVARVLDWSKEWTLSQELALSEAPPSRLNDCLAWMRRARDHPGWLPNPAPEDSEASGEPPTAGGPALASGARLPTHSRRPSPGAKTDLGPSLAGRRQDRYEIGCSGGAPLVVSVDRGRDPKASLPRRGPGPTRAPMFTFYQRSMTPQS